MDSLELLRENRPEGERPTPEAVTAARAALMNAIEAEKKGSTARTKSAPKRRLSGGWRWALGGAVAAVAASAIVLSQVLVPAGQPGAPTNAVAAALNEAADRAAATDTTLQPGQLRKTSITGISTIRWATERDDNSPITSRSRSTIYLPRDRSDAWYYQPGVSDQYKAYDKEGWAWIAENPESTPRGSVNAPTLLFRGLNGIFTRATKPMANGDLNNPELAKVGTDPSALLTHLRETAKQSKLDEGGQNAAQLAADNSAFESAVDRLVFENIVNLFADPTATPAQQATLYRTLALMPTDRVHTTQLQKDGLSLTRFEWSGNIGDEAPATATQITVDSSNGLVHSVSDIRLKSEDNIPVGTVMGSVTFNYEVLDAAPSGAFAADRPLPKCVSGDRPPKGYNTCGEPMQGGSAWGSLD